MRPHGDWLRKAGLRIEPELPESKLEWIEIEALMSKKSRRIAWRELKDDTQWKQGWI